MSAPKRFFVERIEEETLLEGEEFEHAKNVLRLAVGDEVVLLDNSGKEYAAVIAAVEKRNMKLHVLKVNEDGCRTPVRIFEKRGQKRIYRAKGSGTRRQKNHRIFFGIFFRLHEFE